MTPERPAAPPVVMLVGTGDLGGVILELLARDTRIGKIVAVDRDEVRGPARVNLARLSAMAHGFCPDIEFVPADLEDEARVAELIRRTGPGLILTTASPQTWWLPSLLPADARARLGRAGFGAWLPVNLLLSIRLMRAVAASGVEAITLIGPYPDAANPILARLGLAPTAGIGNVDEIVPKIALLAAGRLGVPPATIRVWLIADHAVEPLAFAGIGAGAEPPHYIRIEHDGRDVTAAVGGSELLFRPVALPPGPVTHFLTAGSAARLVGTLISGGEAFLHVPGPLGLPGGYPVTVAAGAIDLALPPGLSRDEAVAINERARRLDGIDRIEDDGSVVFTPGTVEALDETLGYRCERLSPAEVPGRAGELMARFRQYARRHGIDVDARAGR